MNRSTAELSTLRTALGTGSMRIEEFRYCAAKRYLELNLPLRARRLLKQLDPSFAPSFTQATVAELTQDAMALARTCTGGRVSLTMIVRNEEKNLGGALDSIDAVVDEIVICDTGSTDHTIRIAQLYGARVEEIEWRNNFAQARNEALRFATGDCILWMDADDRLELASAVALRSIISTGVNSLWMCKVANRRAEGMLGAQFLQARIFPRRPGICFEGRVHEQVVPSIIKLGIPVEISENIRFIHTGYENPELHKVKALRNKPLILEEIAQHPNDPVLRMEWGDSCVLLDQADEALQAYESITSDGENYTRHPDVYTQAHVHLGQLYSMRKEYHRAKQHLLQALYLDNLRIEASLLIGTVYRIENNVDRALFYFIKAIQDIPHCRTTACDTDDIRRKAMYQLAQMLIDIRKFSEAGDLLTNAIANYPAVVDYYTQMGQAMLGMEKIKEAAWYFGTAMHSFPARNPSAYLGLAGIYRIAGDHRRASEILTTAIENDSASVAVWTLLGDALYEIRDSVRALGVYNQVISESAVAPENEKILWQAASCAMDVADTTKAKQYLAKILAMNPENLRAQEFIIKIEQEERLSQKPDKVLNPQL